MRERHTLSFRIAYGGRTLDLHLGRTGLIAAGAAIALLFVAMTQLIYDYRESRASVGELRALRQRVSEQNLTLYNLHEKFESLETEVDRMRALDAKVKSLANINDALRPGAGGKRGGEAGVGGAETPHASAASRLDRLLDLRFEKLKQDVLVSVKDLEILGDRLDVRRLVLESVPSLWPVRGVISSPFGVRTSPFTETEVFHQGVDIRASKGTPVKAAAGGKVLRSGYEALLGNCVVLEHGNGYRTLYAHLSQIDVRAGDFLERGDTVGRVGATGRTTGAHLHFEVLVNGLQVNPSRFLN